MAKKILCGVVLMAWLLSLFYWVVVDKSKDWYFPFVVLLVNAMLLPGVVYLLRVFFLGWGVDDSDDLGCLLPLSLFAFLSGVVLPIFSGNVRIMKMLHMFAPLILFIVVVLWMQWREKKRDAKERRRQELERKRIAEEKRQREEELKANPQMAEEACREELASLVSNLEMSVDAAQELMMDFAVWQRVQGYFPDALPEPYLWPYLQSYFERGYKYSLKDRAFGTLLRFEAKWKEFGVDAFTSDVSEAHLQQAVSHYCDWAKKRHLDTFNSELEQLLREQGMSLMQAQELMERYELWRRVQPYFPGALSEQYLGQYVQRRFARGYENTELNDSQKAQFKALCKLEDKWKNMGVQAFEVQVDESRVKQVVPRLCSWAKQEHERTIDEKRRAEIRDYLRLHGVKYFYHFTARDNLPKIKSEGGLYSWGELEKRGVEIPHQGGGQLSRDLDKNYGLQDYVRLSFCSDHPMIYRHQQAGVDMVLLKVSVEVAELEGVKFSDMNATKTGHRIDVGIDGLKLVDIKATQATFVSRDSLIFDVHQAEVLVKTHIPLKYILNIDNPDLGIRDEANTPPSQRVVSIGGNLSTYLQVGSR